MTGNAMIRVRFNERQSDEYKVWLEPAARDWILVGIAEGTAAYNTISGNMETATAADREEGLEQDGRVAFFAKGRIKGDFLLTMAYDSAREKDDARDRAARHHRARSLLPAVRRRHRAALRGRFAGQAVPQDRAPPVRRAVRRLRHRLHGHRAHALQPQPVGPAQRLRRRARAGVRLRGAHRHRPGAGRAARRRHRGPVSPVALAHRHRQRQAAHRGARPLRDHARASRRASCRASSTTTSTTSAARCSSSSRCRAATRTSTRSSSWSTTKCAPAARTRPRPACAWRPSSPATSSRSAPAPYTKARRRATPASSAPISPGACHPRRGCAPKWRSRSRTIRCVRSPRPPGWSKGKHVSEHLEARAWARETETGFGVGQQLTADTGTRSAGVDARYRFSDKLSADGELQHQQVLASDATRLLASADVPMQRDGYSRRRRPAPRRRRRRQRRRARFRPGLVTRQRRCVGWPRHAARRSRCHARRQRRERRLPGARHPRRRLPPVRRHHSVCRIRTRRRRSAQRRHHALRHAHASRGSARRSSRASTRRPPNTVRAPSRTSA